MELALTAPMERNSKVSVMEVVWFREEGGQKKSDREMVCDD